MSSEQSFQDLMARVRTGDSDAFAELFARYGDFIRRAARMRMFSARLRRAFGSEDVFQSVVKSFWLRIASEGNQWKIDTPADLTRLFATMTQNKVSSRARQENAIIRGGGLEPKPLEGSEIRGNLPQPDEVAAIKEEYQKYWRLLDQDARALCQMRFESEMSWDEIGAALGTTGDACRKKLQRVFDDLREHGDHPPPELQSKPGRSDDA